MEALHSLHQLKIKIRYGISTGSNMAVFTAVLYDNQKRETAQMNTKQRMDTHHGILFGH